MQCSNYKRKGSLKATFFIFNCNTIGNFYNQGYVSNKNIFSTFLENVKKSLKKYYEDFKFKHPTPNDFQRVAEKVSGIQLDWYLNEWIETYSTSPKEKTVVDIKLEYFNTSSSKCILDLFKKLERINQKGAEVHVNWYFEQDDEDMEEAGEDYQAIIKLPFKMIEVEEI